MQLSDVDLLLGTSYVGSSDEPMYEAQLEAAKSQAKEYCNNDFLVEQEDGTYIEEYPKSVQMGVSMMVKSMSEDQNVASESLEGMSQSFFENGTFKSALVYFKPFRKVGFK